MDQIDRSQNPTLSVTAAGPSRRDLLAIAAALLVGACSKSDEVALPAAPLAPALMRQLPELSNVVAELSAKNNKLTQSEYESYFVRLVNAFNSDLGHSFGVRGLQQFERFSDLQIAPSDAAALEHGLILTYYPTKSQSTGLCAINVVVKCFGEEGLSAPPKTNYQSDLLPRIDMTELRFAQFQTVMSTPDFPSPVGTMIHAKGCAWVLLDEAQVRKNARAATVSEDGLVSDVLANEIGHYVFLKYLGLSESARRDASKKVTLSGEATPRDFIEVEEAFSDYYTFQFGGGSIDYHIITYPSRTEVGQYGLTNDIFTRALNKWVAANATILQERGLSGSLDHRSLASALHNDERLRHLQGSLKSNILGEYIEFFRRNLPAIRAQMLR